MLRRTGEGLKVPKPGERSYIPERGHLVWLWFTPQAGREQAGRRPGLVLSPGTYNARAGLAVVCPIMSQVKGYPFEVALPPALAISGVVLADHVRSLDWQARRVEFAGIAPAEVVREVTEKIRPLVGF